MLTHYTQIIDVQVQQGLTSIIVICIYEAEVSNIYNIGILLVSTPEVSVLLPGETKL